MPEPEKKTVELSIDALEKVKGNSPIISKWLEDRQIVSDGIDKILKGITNIRVGDYSRVKIGLTDIMDEIDDDVLTQGSASDLSKAIKDTGAAIEAMVLTPEGKASHQLRAYIAALVSGESFRGGGPTQLKDYNIWLKLRDDDAAIARFNNAIMIQFGTSLNTQLSEIQKWVDAIDRLFSLNLAEEFKKVAKVPAGTVVTATSTVT